MASTFLWRFHTYQKTRSLAKSHLLRNLIRSDTCKKPKRELIFVTMIENIATGKLKQCKCLSSLMVAEQICAQPSPEPAG